MFMSMNILNIHICHNQAKFKVEILNSNVISILFEMIGIKGDDQIHLEINNSTIYSDLIDNFNEYCLNEYTI